MRKETDLFVIISLSLTFSLCHSLILTLPPAVPPKRVVLEEPLPRRSGSAVSLACTAEDSNPRTTLLWFRGSGEPILDAGTSMCVCVFVRCVRLLPKVSCVAAALLFSKWAYSLRHKYPAWPKKRHQRLCDSRFVSRNL